MRFVGTLINILKISRSLPKNKYHQDWGTIGNYVILHVFLQVKEMFRYRMAKYAVSNKIQFLLFTWKLTWFIKVSSNGFKIVTDLHQTKLFLDDKAMKILVQPTESTCTRLFMFSSKVIVLMTSCVTCYLRYIFGVTPAKLSPARWPTNWQFCPLADSLCRTKVGSKPALYRANAPSPVA